MTWDAIAGDAQVGLPSPQHAAMDGIRGLKEARALLAKQAGLFVTLETERLDALELAGRGVLERAQAAHADDRVLRAIDRLTLLSARRSALLGMDARAGSEPEQPAEDGVDELARRRADRRSAAAHR